MEPNWTSVKTVHKPTSFKITPAHRPSVERVGIETGFAVLYYECASNLTKFTPLSRKIARA